MVLVWIIIGYLVLMETVCMLFAACNNSAASVQSQSRSTAGDRSRPYSDLSPLRVPR